MERTPYTAVAPSGVMRTSVTRSILRRSVSLIGCLAADHAATVNQKIGRNGARRAKDMASLQHRTPVAAHGAQCPPAGSFRPVRYNFRGTETGIDTQADRLRQSHHLLRLRAG